MQQPELTPTRTRVGWRLPAIAVVIILVAVVTVSRLGAPAESPSAKPTDTAVAQAPSPTPATEPSFFIRVPAIEPTPDPQLLTYPDGIPLQINDEPVYRVSDALGLWSRGITDAIGQILVGGWHKAKARCDRRPRKCPVETMADTPLDVNGDLSTDWIALDGSLGGGVGPRVIRATIEPDPRCSIQRSGACQPRLRVVGVLWVDGRETIPSSTRVRMF